MKISRPLFLKYLSVATSLLTVLAGIFVPGSRANAAEDNQASSIQVAASDTGQTIYDQIWGLPVLYKDKSNPYIEEISLFGRFHANWTDVESSRGDWSDWEARRVRAGLKVKFLQDFEARAEVRFLPFETRAYDGFTEITLNWSPSPAFKLSLGKQLARFTMEGIISANELLTLERSNIAHTFWTGEDNVTTGVSISGDIGQWQYYAGIFSGEMDESFGRLDAGFFAVVGLGYDFATQLQLDRAVLRLDYIHNDGNPLNTAPKAFENTTTLGWDLKQGKFGITGNVIYGSGIGPQPDVYGLVVAPSFALTKKLEVVLRYTFLKSEAPRGIRPERRYQNEVPDIAGNRGDRYQSIYAAINYYIYGHKLKFQTGVDYAHMDDGARQGGNFDAWTFSSGFRFSF